MTARDDLLQRLVDAQVRVVTGQQAVVAAERIMRCVTDALDDARKELRAATAEFMAADRGPERDGLTWTAADEEAVSYLLVPEQDRNHD